MQIENLNKNHVVVTEGDVATLFSYGKAIAKKVSGEKTVLDEEYFDYSTTTARYRNQFLGLTSPEFKKAVKSGLFDFDTLNG